MTWKKRLHGCVHNVSVDYKIFDTSNIIDIDKYLIKTRNIK